MVMVGSCRWILDGHPPLDLAQGDFILMPPGTRHHESPFAQDWYGLGFAGFDLGSPPEPRWPDGMFNRPHSSGEHYEEMKLLLEILFRENDPALPGHKERADMALRQLLILAWRCTLPRRRLTERNSHGLSRRQADIARAAAHHLSQTMDRPPSISQLAGQHSLCPSYFSTLFRRHHGRSPKAFLNKLRAERARELLRNPSLTVKDVAAQLGFTDAAHFCKFFKRETGLRPGACRPLP